MSADSFSRRSFDSSALFGIAIFVAALRFYSSAFADNIHEAATGENLQTTQESAKASPAPVSGNDVYHDPPLIAAISDYHPEVALSLIYSGADIEAADYNGATPLNWAAARGYKDVVALLLARGAKVDASRKDGITPLIWASNKEVAELLVKHGADVNAVDEDGDTPIITAEYSHGSDRSDWVRLLLAHGANVDLIRSPGLWIRIHCLWIIGAAGAAIAGWLYYFRDRRKFPAPSRLTRVAWWLGIYLAGSWTVVVIGIWRLGFVHKPLLFALEPLHLPSCLTSLLPAPWIYALFEHLPAAVVTWSLDLAPFGAYLLLLVLSMCVKRFQTFCFLLVLLMILIFLSGFGLAVGMANFPVPD
jgi:Ankyrin repeats (3 copies)